MLDAKARDALAGLSSFFGRLIARSGLTPNAVTLLGLTLVGVASWRVVAGDLAMAGWILGAGGVFDFFDGAVARATGKSSRFGAFLDSVTDRVSDALVLGAIAWAFRDQDPTTFALALASLGVANLVSYVRAKAESLGYDCRVGLMERAERVFVLCAGLIFGYVAAALWVLAVGSGLTLLQRLVHIGKQARER